MSQDQAADPLGSDGLGFVPHRRAAGVLLIARSGDFLLQWRDDIAGIEYPGRLAFFGGALEPGETPAEGAAREVAEETGLEIAPEDLQFLARQVVTIGPLSPRDLWYYAHAHVDPAALVITEGQLFTLPRAAIAAHWEQLTPNAIMAIKLFLEAERGLIAGVPAAQVAVS